MKYEIKAEIELDDDFGDSSEQIEEVRKDIQDIIGCYDIKFPSVEVKIFELKK